MMTITEKVAYLKGLAEGMKMDSSTNEGKLLLAVIDTLDDIALTVSDLEDTVAELSAQVDEIDDDLGDEDEDCGCDGEDFDDTLYEVECPNCGDVICLDEEMLDEGEIDCPNCGEKLEFDFEDGDEPCGCGHHHED